ncbi:MBL fold metallo-hydrolase [Alkalihalobacterium bogoriense]|uniref:MBL fold metallo-hydrolase n=1 Tax=Alkalihalobacterium bogoriense TaxID=246272 RepID=UPI00047B15D1|nr:MBL fold metallo-hydrolase [Alkalihalobacterium bogoriense]
MNIHQIPLGPLQTNCYVLSNDKGEAVIFDPGGNAEQLQNFLTEQQYTPVAILLTHAHFDHIGAVDFIREKWDIPVYLHENEKGWLSDPAQNGSMYFMGDEEVKMKEASHLVVKEEPITVGPFTFTVFFTPGHSPGSISYYFEKENIVFSGDALFSGSIGRTDLPGGNHEQLLQSIHSKLLELPEETVVASGHGPTTTIGNEMDSNPFLSGF